MYCFPICSVEPGGSGVYPELLTRPCDQVERSLRRIKRFRRVLTRYDKLDVLFLNFLFRDLVGEALADTNRSQKERLHFGLGLRKMLRAQTGTLLCGRHMG